ncbi:MAG: DUF3786 domain-containing protein [Clostridia bacterium]|nr:DUF3786 domain-containing protein [Clostridia bacterium]
MAVSNYEITKHRVEAEFHTHDLAPVLEKFPLSADERYLYLTFVSMPCRIDRVSGKITCSEDGFATCEEAGFNLTLSVFDLLIDSQPACRPAGSYCRVNSLPGVVKTASAPAEDEMFRSHAARIEENPEGFRRACLSLCGEPYGIGDLSFRIPIFEGLCAVVQFWYADEDFPPQLQVLWDSNILQYVRYETVWYIRGYLMERIFEKSER